MKSSSPFRVATLLMTAIAAVAALPAGAQEAAAPAVAVPQMNCPNPGSMPIDTNGTAVGRYQKKVSEYQACVNTYAKAQAAKASEYSAQAQAYNDAANKAVDEYNTFAHQLNEQAKNRN